MSYKMFALKLSATLLVGLLASTSALACEIRTQDSNLTPEGQNRSGYHAGDVFSFGDLKLKVNSEYDLTKYDTPGPDYRVSFDLKAPPKYVKRDVQLKIGGMFSDTICGREVSIKTSGSRFMVNVF